MNSKSPFFAALLATLLGTPALAHHSFTMFDSTQTVTVEGKVSEYKWSMPHVWIYVQIAGKSGPEEWGMEAHSPNIAARKGWSSKTVKPGDTIKVTMHPRRDGTPSGSVVSITLSDGTILWNAESKERT